ncbi:MAG: hypothetical protein ACP5LX_01980 [Nitrososphaeria archaeon]
MQPYLQLLSFVVFTFGCFFLSYGIDVSFKDLKITHFLYLLFPFITTFPELAIFVYGIFWGIKGTEVAIGTVLGEPFIVMSMGLFIYKLWTKRPLKTDKGSRSSLLTFVLVSGFFFISYFVSRYFSILMIVSLVVYEYLSQKAFKKENYTKIKKIPLFYTLFGLAIITLTGKYVVESTVSLAEYFKVQPSIISFILIPLISSAPELMAPFVFSNRDETEQIASLIAELPITMSIYPTLLFLFAGLEIASPLILGVAISTLQAIFLISEEKTGKNITVVTSIFFLMVFCIILIFHM